MRNDVKFNSTLYVGEFQKTLLDYLKWFTPGQPNKREPKPLIAEIEKVIKSFAETSDDKQKIVTRSRYNKFKRFLKSIEKEIEAHPPVTRKKNVYNLSMFLEKYLGNLDKQFYVRTPSSYAKIQTKLQPVSIPAEATELPVLTEIIVEPTKESVESTQQPPNIEMNNKVENAESAPQTSVEHTQLIEVIVENHARVIEEPYSSQVIEVKESENNKKVNTQQNGEQIMMSSFDEESLERESQPFTVIPVSNVILKSEDSEAYSAPASHDPFNKGEKLAMASSKEILKSISINDVTNKEQLLAFLKTQDPNKWKEICSSVSTLDLLNFLVEPKNSKANTTFADLLSVTFTKMEDKKDNILLGFLLYECYYRKREVDGNNTSFSGMIGTGLSSIFGMKQYAPYQKTDKMKAVDATHKALVCNYYLDSVDKEKAAQEVDAYYDVLTQKTMGNNTELAQITQKVVDLGLKDIVLPRSKAKENKSTEPQFTPTILRKSK